jgi:hypothetical protein
MGFLLVILIIGLIFHCLLNDRQQINISEILKQIDK